MFLKGLVFGLALVLVLACAYPCVMFVMDTRAKAVQGAEAYAYIAAQIAAQKQETK